MQYTHDKTVNFVIILHTYRFFKSVASRGGFFEKRTDFPFLSKK